MQPNDPVGQSNSAYVGTSRTGKVIQPLSPEYQSAIPATGTPPGNPAIDMIRNKLAQLYAQEPGAAQETQAATQAPKRSRHQQFMYDLSTSGRSLADIQVAWHAYYQDLSDIERREVWQEFYQAHAQARSNHVFSPAPQPNSAHQQTKETAAAAATPAFDPTKPISQTIVHQPKAEPESKPENNEQSELAPKPSVSELQRQLVDKIATRAKSKPKGHLQSLLFGLCTGLIVVVIMLFGFFNERFIAPFMTPSRAISSAPIIIDPNNTAAGPNPEIIIPKINVDIPVVYDVDTIEEPAVESGLERGVVHYATTPNPGELGNGVIFGHSANNILNKGKYKFAFVLLHKMDIGDTFYLNKDGKRYVYRIYGKKIVPPSDVSVLNRNDKPATFTLITCDPPGTSLNRLVVVGEQISPDPSGNAQSKVDQNAANRPQELPSNAPTLWSRFWNWVSN